MQRRSLRANLALMALGAFVVVLAALFAGRVISGVEGTAVAVRPASPAEAPNPGDVGRTVVAEPDGTPSVLPRVRGLVLKLIGLALCAALGVGQVVWGLWDALAQRRTCGQHQPKRDGKASK